MSKFWQRNRSPAPPAVEAPHAQPRMGHHRLGESALRLADNLPPPAVEEPFDPLRETYGRDDLSTLEQAILFDDDLPKYPEVALPSDVHTLVDEYHRSLPFVSGERDWLIRNLRLAIDLSVAENDRIHWDHGREVSEAHLREQPHPFAVVGTWHGLILSHGRRVPVEGDKLLARWVDWRHAGGLFEHEPTVERSQRFLQEIGRHCLESGA